MQFRKLPLVQVMSEGGQTHDGQQELFTAARIAREAESKSTKWAPSPPCLRQVHPREESRRAADRA